MLMRYSLNHTCSAFILLMEEWTDVHTILPSHYKHNGMSAEFTVSHRRYFEITETEPIFGHEVPLNGTRWALFNYV